MSCVKNEKKNEVVCGCVEAGRNKTIGCVLGFEPVGLGVPSGPAERKTKYIKRVRLVC